MDRECHVESASLGCNCFRGEEESGLMNWTDGLILNFDVVGSMMESGATVYSLVT